MQGKQLYEYAVIRVVPRVEREEFINVGVVLYIHGSRYICMRYMVPEERILSLCSKVDMDEVRAYLHAFDQISHGAKDSGAIGRLDAASRFRWLTAYRSTIIQTSRVHPGFCIDPDAELQRLFEELVV